ncbi:MAG TPA: sterol desaturase family protein [Sphingomonadales bacterium]|nr:sterol desaturase family protein [Sphingomonadales bacterium]
MIARYGFWNNRRYSLEKMTLQELIGAYFQYYAINAYLALGVVSAVLAVLYVTNWALAAIGIVLAALVYPLAWYVLHRNVLHGRFLYRSALTAKLWKRIHYDHHQDPHDLGVLFGALYTTLPTVFLVTAPVGWLLNGLGGAAAAFSAGMFTTCFYEFAHCIQHLSYKPRNKLLLEMKTRHMEHHFHDEKGNYGITNFFWDKVCATYYRKTERPRKSANVHNLGYDAAEAKKYPWVARLSGGIGLDNPRLRRQG